MQGKDRPGDEAPDRREPGETPGAEAANPASQAGDPGETLTGDTLTGDTLAGDEPGRDAAPESGEDWPARETETTPDWTSGTDGPDAADPEATDAEWAESGARDPGGPSLEKRDSEAEEGVEPWAPEWDQTSPTEPPEAASPETEKPETEKPEAEKPEAEHEPAPEPVAAEPEDEDHRSIAGRVLTWLFFLVAGAGLILWAGPRIAPHLPSGLEPVAVWLTPGSESTADQDAARAALRAELAARIEAIEPGMQPEAVEALLAERTAALRTELATAREETAAALRERIGTLSDKVASQDSGEIESRLAGMETSVSGLEAELATLKSQLAGVAETDGQIPEEAAQRIAAFAATVEGLKGELQGLASRVGALAQRVDEVEAASRRRETEAAAREAEAEAAAAERERIAALREAVAQLGTKIEAGTPYEDELAAVEAHLDTAVPEGLRAAAPDGVPTLKELLDGFPDAAHAAIRSSATADPGDGVIDRATAFLGSRVATRSLEEREGDSTDAILSRVEARLQADRPSEALAEAEALSAEARTPLEAWLGRLARRANALAGFATLRDAVDATN